LSADGITVDSGFLIAVERSKPRAMTMLRASRTRRQRLVVPAAVLAEWWRGSPRHAQVLSAFTVEPMSEALAKVAGEALAAVPGSTVVDAIVMASGASRGDVVYTSDFDDLSRLRAHFRAVRLFTV
jgi:predicted nucleic acid-binding protein